MCRPIWSGILFGGMSAYFFLSHQWFLAVGFFGLSGLSDVIDGMVARARGLQSSFGSFFDNFCSAYADSTVFAGLITATLCDPWWGVAALVGTLTRLLTFRLDGLVSKDEEPKRCGHDFRAHFSAKAIASSL